MQDIIVRYESCSDSCGLGELIGLTYLPPCHPYLLFWINNVEERCKQIVKIECKRLASESEDIQKRYEGLQLSGVDDL